MHLNLLYPVPFSISVSKARHHVPSRRNEGQTPLVCGNIVRPHLRILTPDRLNGSRAQGTLWLLEELQIPYELEIYHRQENFLAPPELEKVHPLGKSPTITITTPGSPEPLVLAESAFIVQYLSEHFAGDASLLPKRWKEGPRG